jgi:hypothetical protein
MNYSRLKKTLAYQFNNVGWSCLYVYGIAIVVTCILAAGFVSFSINGATTTLYNLGPVAFLHFLIIGIAGIRDDLRFFLQHGIGRRTTYFSHLYSSLIAGFAVGLFCVLYSLAWSGVLGSFWGGPVFNIPGFLLHWLIHGIGFFLAWQLGVLISLIYYRLGKLQKVVFSVLAVASILFALPQAVNRLIGASGDFGDMIERVVVNPPNLTAPLLLASLPIGILMAAGNYLLLRRAPVRD